MHNYFSVIKNILTCLCSQRLILFKVHLVCGLLWMAYDFFFFLQFEKKRKKNSCQCMELLISTFSFQILTPVESKRQGRLLRLCFCGRNKMCDISFLISFLLNSKAENWEARNKISRIFGEPQQFHILSVITFLKWHFKNFSTIGHCKA